MKIDILVDYLSFSSKSHGSNQIKELLGIEEAEFVLIKGRNGWTDAIYTEGIRIFYGGTREDIGVDISGVGCRNVESYNNLSFDWPELLKYLIDDDAMNISRLDIACDDHEEILSFEKLVKHTSERKYISKARRRVWIQGDEQEIIFGSSKSDTRLRIYNKALERGVEEHWIRAEFQFRDTAADSFIFNLMEQKNDIGRTYGGVLLNYLRYTIKAPDENNNNNRIPTTDWWDKFVGTSERIKNFTTGGIEYNYFNLEAFLVKQCASSIKTFIEANQGDMTRLFEIINKAKHSDKQKALLKNLGSEFSGNREDDKKAAV